MSDSHRFQAVSESLDYAYDTAEKIAEEGGSARPFLAVATARDSVLSKSQVIEEGISAAAEYVDSGDISGAFREIDYIQACVTTLHNTAVRWTLEYRRVDETLGSALFQLAWNIAKYDSTLDGIRREAESLSRSNKR